MTDFMNYARKRGWMPDWAWYQLNGQPAHENWAEQRKEIYQTLTEPENPDEEIPYYMLVSEVRVK